MHKDNGSTLKMSEFTVVVRVVALALFTFCSYNENCSTVFYLSL